MRRFTRLVSTAALACGMTGFHRGPVIAASRVDVTYREGTDVSIRTGSLAVRLTPQQVLSVALVVDGRERSLASKSPAGSSVPSDYVTVAGKDVRNFAIDYSKISVRDVATRLGNCKQVRIPSSARDDSLALEKVLDVDLCPAFPQSVVLTATYRNLGTAPVQIDRVMQASQAINSLAGEAKGLWTFQGASRGEGSDQIFSMPASFQADNPVGQMERGGHGGGIPVNDFWNDQVGLAVGHVEPDAVAGWMPVKTSGTASQIGFETRPGKVLAPQATLATPRAFVTVHRGDFYEPLATYRSMLLAQGVDFPKATESLYEPIWWTYAFGHNFRPEEVYNAIPKFKELGIRWIIINNRWWDHYGDWMPRTDKFASEAGFERFLARLRQEGLKTLPWWLPYGVQVNELGRSGLYNDPQGRPMQAPEIEKMIAATADVALRHRDWLITDPQGKLARISRNLAALCPAYAPARGYMVQLATRMIRDWKADGFYMDVVYTVPSCYNPAHHHASPYDSVKQLPRLFEDFRKVVERYNPQGMLMICPCGTTMNHCLLHTTHEPVTADPVGAEQVRWRVKMYKALMGPSAPVFADRVESTGFNRIYATDAETGTDFASGMGTGGIIGTILIWPKIDKLPGDLEYRGELDTMKRLLLTPEKDAWWKKWFDLYHQKMLSSGEFLNLYTLGVDVPEGYAIRKSGKLYYAFFAPAPRPWGLDARPRLPASQDHTWQGRLELRGLDKSKSYQVLDYENDKKLGRLQGAAPYLDTAFTNHLLLEVTTL